MERILSKQTIWHGRVFDFVEKEIVLPNGRKTMMGMVQHPGSSAIVPVLEDGSVILIHQYRSAIQDFIWEVPAGTMDAGEDPVDCAKRELQEECGYAANHFEKVGEIWVTPGYSSECIHLFLATELILKEPHLDEDECLSVHIFPFREVLSMVERNEIREAMTIIALQKVYPVWTEMKGLSPAR